MSKLDVARRACAVGMLCAAAAVISKAQTLTTILSFNGTDGQYPQGAALVQATDGNIYGTTPNGGTNGSGTVFKTTPNGILTVIYNFCSQSNCADGANPLGALVQGEDGNFYGTTASGGASAACTGGCGTVFKITPRGALTTLHSFELSDGAEPFFAALLVGTDGNFYGTTPNGGASAACTGGCGTVFKITPTGTLTTMHSFESTDGAGPLATLVQATDGNFYGTTDEGGASAACSYGCGTIFKMTPKGNLETVHSFDSTDGGYPFGALVQATDGNLYGTTSFGGAFSYGTVFRITLTGSLTTLYSFCSLSGCADGEDSYAGLIQATDGNFYGVTPFGGASGFAGTVFKITRTGTLTTLYSFCSARGCGNGDEPIAGLIQDTNGKLYGTTYSGGANDDGTVYGLQVSLGPFVKTQPVAGKVGAVVSILGTNLTGATSITFNGTPATFTVESSSYIKTTVPSGATTGAVQVVTSKGKLSSNLPFRVMP